MTCGDNAECLNTEGTYSCQCKSGFAGDGYNCADQSCMLYYILVVHEHTLVLRSIPLRYKVSILMNGYRGWHSFDSFLEPYYRQCRSE